MLGQAMTLRSQQPDGVIKSWATLLMYNLIRLEITRIADEAKVQPCRISFITALRYIVDEWLGSSGSHPGAILAKLAAMRRTSAACAAACRSHRRYPREVPCSRPSIRRHVPPVN